MQRNKNLTRRISPAREVAFSVLQAVDGGAYASDALRELAADLDSRDAGLASEIVFGALRYRGQLDCLIHQYSGRDANSVDGAVRTVLRMAIYQMRYLDRVPPHAAVDEAVELTKRAKRAASGLVNAVLRKVNRAPVTWPDEATEFSCPAWLLERWKRHFGIDSARAIASAALETPVNYVRIAEGTTAPGSMQLERTGVPRAFRVLSPIPPGIRMHDIGSQAIVPLLELS